jgi:hypothetical protein
MSNVAQPSIPTLPVRIWSRLVLWVGLGLAAAAGIAVALVLIINSSDQGTKTAAAPVKQTATYPGRPDEGLGTLTSQPSGYTARPDEGLAPISTQSTDTQGPTERPTGGHAAPSRFSAGARPAGPAEEAYADHSEPAVVLRRLPSNATPAVPWRVRPSHETCSPSTLTRRCREVRRQNWPNQLHHRGVELGRLVDERLVSRLLERDEPLERGVGASSQATLVSAGTQWSFRPRKKNMASAARAPAQ